MLDSFTCFSETLANGVQISRPFSTHQNSFILLLIPARVVPDTLKVTMQLGIKAGDVCK